MLVLKELVGDKLYNFNVYRVAKLLKSLLPVGVDSVIFWETLQVCRFAGSDPSLFPSNYGNMHHGHQRRELGWTFYPNPRWTELDNSIPNAFYRCSGLPLELCVRWHKIFEIIMLFQPFIDMFLVDAI